MQKTDNLKETLEQMLKKGLHFGHRTFKWNPKMAPYIYSRQNGIHIIDIRQSYKCLQEAKMFIRNAVAEGKTVLMVSTKPQACKLVKETAQLCNVPYVVQKWMGGLLTNYATIKKRISYLKSLEEQEEKGEFEKYTKKEALELRKTIKKLENALGGVANMTGIADIMFIADVVKDKTALKEAKKMGVTVVGIVDTNADPSNVDYVIPANDDSVEAVRYILQEMKEAICEGQKNRKPVEEKNKVQNRESLTEKNPIIKMEAVNEKNQINKSKKSKVEVMQDTPMHF